MLKIAINGYGRIGRCILRSIFESNRNKKIQIIAINDIMNFEAVNYLTKFDSTHGHFPFSVHQSNGFLFIEKYKIKLFNEPDISKISWSALGVDIVLDCTGQLSDVETLSKHLKQGAKKVIVSHLTKDDVDTTIVYGVNENSLSNTHNIISTSSCTANCIVPILEVLESSLGIQAGVITQLHSLMNDQPILDSFHSNELSKTRSGISSVAQVKTRLIEGIERTLPNLRGKMEAVALRIPIINVSSLHLSVYVKKDTTVEAINKLFKTVSNTNFKGIIKYDKHTSVSCDYIHDSCSAIINGNLTKVSQNRLIKISAWFDNEWGYTNRMIDTAIYINDNFIQRK